ncbi:WXG100 family type VII secretion target [Streptomyces sp. NBC_00433]
MPTLSPDEYRVALGDLRTAIGSVRAESEHVSGLIGQIQSHFEAAHSYWQSPSATSFETMSTWLNGASRDLQAVLDEMARRLQTAYDNYADAEVSNTGNLGGGGPKPPAGGPGPNTGSTRAVVPPGQARPYEPALAAAAHRLGSTQDPDGTADFTAATVTPAQPAAHLLSAEAMGALIRNSGD